MLSFNISVIEQNLHNLHIIRFDGEETTCNMLALGVHLFRLSMASQRANLGRCLSGENREYPFETVLFASIYFHEIQEATNELLGIDDCFRNFKTRLLPPCI